MRKRQRALLLGFKQAHVFDRDRRLAGEGLEKRDLVVGEWPEQNYSSGVRSRSNGVPSVVRWPWRFASLLPDGYSLSSAARSWT